MLEKMNNSANHPDIIHVGYSKSASSWLRNLLANNSNIRLITEVRCLSRILENKQIEYKAYLDYFKKSEGDSHMVKEKRN